MLGVILCGGQSTRMGTDKGLLLMAQQTWAELAFDKMKSLEIKAVVSVNEEQSVAYSKLFAELLIDHFSLSVKGPLLGLLTAHLQYPDVDLLVLACDMIDMNSNLLNTLLETHITNPHEACIYLVDGKPQPLCGIYSAKGLHKILNLYQQGTLQRFSMMYMLDSLDTNYILADRDQWPSFNNYNSREDLVESKA